VDVAGVDATDDTRVSDAADDAAPPDAGAEAAPGDAAPEDGAGGCPADMVPVMGACMDRYEAPNVAGALPLVMYTFTEGEAWCAARGRRLCFDDEWQTACEGPDLWAYPYGATQVPGECNDDKVWRTYNQTLLNGWPPSASSPSVGSLADLFAAARAVSTTAAAAADHVESLYQGEGGGASPGCVGVAGVYDLCGNVEEWTRRRDGGEAQFHGNLKGRYWAESRTCQSGVTTHGDGFRFYEIGFRCCQDP
jgi:formylglycine-generating enzyme required for sulfatase activity